MIDEAGATTAELVIVFPAALLSIMLALHFALYLHAAQIAEAGAQEAVEAAQGEPATASDGERAARRLLDDLGALRAPAVTVDRSATTVSATVTGDAQEVVPGLPVGVEARAVGPVERFVPEGVP